MRQAMDIAKYFLVMRYISAEANPVPRGLQAGFAALQPKMRMGCATALGRTK